MATRTDIHRPSQLIPTDYTWVGITTAHAARLSYLPEVRRQNAQVEAHMAQTGGSYSQHRHKGNCDSCGAHCRYMAIFHYPKSNSYVRVGLDCAEKIGIGDVNAFRTFMKVVQAAQHHRAGKRKAEGLLKLAQLDKAYETWLLMTDLPQALSRMGLQADTPLGIVADFAEEYGVETALVLRAFAQKPPIKEAHTLCDIVGKVVKYGNLSANQTRYLRTLLNQIEGVIPQAAPPQDEAALPDRFPDRRPYEVVARGTIRRVESDLTDVGAIRVLRTVQSDDFVASLLRQYDANSRQMNALSGKQWNWVHVLAEERVRAQHEEQVREASAVQVAQPGELQGIHDLFRHAQTHLQRARIRLAVPHNDSFRVYTLFPSRRAGHVGVAGADASTGRGMVGEINPEGVLLPRYNAPGEVLVNALRAFSADPATGAKESAKLCGQCCFCGLTLTDPKSTDVGYGPICAQHYGLPWGPSNGPSSNGQTTQPAAQVPTPAPQAPVGPTSEVPQATADSPQAEVMTNAFPTDALHWDGKAKTFTTEASDLGWTAHLLAVHGWPSEVLLTSHKTGTVKTFKAHSLIKDTEGDLLRVRYHCDGLWLTVFND